MSIKKGNSKKGAFSLAPITLSEPIRATDGFTNLVEIPADQEKALRSPHPQQGSDVAATKKPSTKREIPEKQTIRAESFSSNDARENPAPKVGEQQEKRDDSVLAMSLTETELLRILDADSIDEIYELTDVLRASSLKLYATLVCLADSRGRARVKNHELMSKAGIKGIATLYKQERWLMDLKLLEKKAKPGPHDGSSYVVHKLERLPLPTEIYEKFDKYLKQLK